ncbi:3-phenylpropionate/trans-cinnamate dioxygenase ferredoxin subunit [Saccharomonospora viridis]|jgi:3-phenylpropionate/trans-cinnamate dioxygenase ferredoxin component|nr:3-phenylpropionate/trans-cinnamate dioxygenase ferredoxin subunit [Saccharomonospora viridis]
MLCCALHSVFRDKQQESMMILVGAASDIPVGESVRVQGRAAIAVFNVDGEFYAIDDTCTHQDASLSDGWLEGCAVECPLHSVCFDLRTGRPSGPPARKPVRTHEVVLIDGLVYVYESTGTAEEVDSTGVATEVVGAVPEEAR